jgi:hypothetical protein
LIDLKGLNVWRESVSKHRLMFALLAGIVATHIATVSGYWYGIIGIPILGWPQYNGILLLGHTGSSMSGAEQFWAGTVYHYMTGICFSLIYVYLIHPIIRGGNSFAGNIVKALAWGVVLATVSALLWVPRDFPEFHPGFFSNNLGWKTVIGIYIWHLVYGLHLGALYNPTPEGAAERAPVAEAVSTA